MAKIKHILLLDNDPDFLKNTIAKLKSYEIEVTATSSLRDFLKEYQSSHWDIIMIDVNIDQGVSGFDLIRSIRQNQKKNVPIVLISRDQEKEKIAHGIECGADDYLGKPIDYTIAIPKFSQLASDNINNKNQLEMCRVPETYDKAQISVAYKVKSISELGLTLISTNYINKGSFIEVSGDVIASFIGVDSLRLQVGKTEMSNGTYTIELSWPENSDFLPYLQSRILSFKNSPSG